MTDLASTRHITFIGAGNMASAIFGGMVESGYPKEKITATARSQETQTRVAEQYGIETLGDNLQAVAKADVVVLSVKPQMMQALCETLKAQVQVTKPLIISVAAGIETETLNQWLGGNLAVVRCMPNTPSLVGAGVSGLFANQAVSESQRQLVTTLFESVGSAEWVESDKQIDALSTISGSGPAYFFLFMKSLEQAGVALGLDAECARRLAVQTAYGSAKLADQSELTPAELQKQVTSPKGTTERAIGTFEQHEFEAMVKQATQAAYDRARELSQMLAND